MRGRRSSNTYVPLIYRFARRMGLQDAAAADISQEVLTEVARCIRSFEYHPERGRFRDWLGILARRRLGRFLKKKGREATDATEEEADASEPCSADSDWTDEFNARILATALERARPHFEPATWRAFECVWLENRRASEIAIPPIPTPRLNCRPSTRPAGCGRRPGRGSRRA